MKIHFSQHALQQMFRRKIRVSDIQQAIEKGITIKSYDNDKPYPSRLVLYIEKELILHVVYSINAIENQLIVITAYHPDPDLWDMSFKTKKQ
jgi:hypothetical protein